MRINLSLQVVDKSFRVFWVMITYLMAVCVPKLDLMIPLVGVTSGTLCALVYPRKSPLSTGAIAR